MEFLVATRGEHAVHGFTHRDLRDTLVLMAQRLADDPKKSSTQVSPRLHRLHVHTLVAKIPHSRRLRVTRPGHRVMSAALRSRHTEFPGRNADAARAAALFSANAEN